MSMITPAIWQKEIWQIKRIITINLSQSNDNLSDSVSQRCAEFFFILELIQLNLSYFTLAEGGWRNMKNEKYEKQFFGNNFYWKTFLVGTYHKIPDLSKAIEKFPIWKSNWNFLKLLFDDKRKKTQEMKMRHYY